VLGSILGTLGTRWEFDENTKGTKKKIKKIHRPPQKRIKLECMLAQAIGCQKIISMPTFILNHFWPRLKVWQDTNCSLKSSNVVSM